ncbi:MULTISPECIES: hypothetical protein [unclassified Pseudoalteromonas]|uniref:hypothetical protein n=1 Tax=unclassified Pseudoalteromonas TaxID=194690 RepID=UPI0020978BD4|nr:hypothetical protein [Pseudoalteromonas sp. XMcav2-N]MCO7190270.1 hypothetical protein [Pseudoalteromonas sp. XMcav2-N]
MKLKLNKKNLTTLSNNAKPFAKELTPQVAGGAPVKPCTGCVSGCGIIPEM